MTDRVLIERIEKLEYAARELLLQIDDGPRDCYGTQRTGVDVWKGSFLSRVERLRALVPPLDYGDDPCHGPQDTTCPSCGLGR